MAWRGDQLTQISGSEELRITTTRPDGTQRRWTPIWVVRVDDGLYIRSAAGGTSAWYRHATQHNRARIKAGGIEADVTLQPIADAAINTQVSAAYRAKYGNQGSWLAMFLKPPATEATLRLEADSRREP
jgi:hypothetical protein